jgi:hypothetical protein
MGFGFGPFMGGVSHGAGTVRVSHPEVIGNYTLLILPAIQGIESHKTTSKKNKFWLQKGYTQK